MDYCPFDPVLGLRKADCCTVCCQEGGKGGSVREELVLVPQADVTLEGLSCASLVGAYASVLYTLLLVRGRRMQWCTDPLLLGGGLRTCNVYIFS